MCAPGGLGPPVSVREQVSFDLDPKINPLYQLSGQRFGSEGNHPDIRVETACVVSRFHH